MTQITALIALGLPRRFGLYVCFGRYATIRILSFQSESRAYDGHAVTVVVLILGLSLIGTREPLSKRLTQQIDSSHLLRMWADIYIRIFGE